MSPEQCKQQQLDRRSDVFALGVVLWETLAEERLFKRSSELEAMQAIINGERKDLRKLRSDVPEDLIAILDKALAPAKDDRYATADEMRRALLEVCAKHAVSCGVDDVAAFVRPLLGEAQRTRQNKWLQRAREAATSSPVAMTLSEEATVSPIAKQLGVAREPTATRALAEPVIEKTPARAAQRRAPAFLFLLIGFGLMLGVGAGMTDRLFMSGPPLKIGFPPTADKELMLEDTEALREWIESSLDRPATISIAESYEDLQSRLLKGELELASMPPYLYVETKQKDPRVEIVATKLVEGSGGNDSILYVGEASPITDVAGLRGKRLCFPDYKSTTGYLFPRLALKKAGIDPDRDIERHLSGSHTQAMRDLVDGVCDAAATYSGGFLAADRAGVPVARTKQLAIIGRSPHGAMVVPPSLAEAERRRIQAALLAFKPEDGGKNGRVERISGFREGSHADYDGVFEAILGAK
jgi:phosphate/phosphite/phosphonate ABC transporter binding protein